MISVSSFSTRLLDLFMNLQSGMRIDYWSVAHNSTKGGMFILQFFVNSKRDNVQDHRAAAMSIASKHAGSAASRASACYPAIGVSVSVNCFGLYATPTIAAKSVPIKTMQTKPMTAISHVGRGVMPVPTGPNIVKMGNAAQAHIAANLNPCLIAVRILSVRRVCFL